MSWYLAHDEHDDTVEDILSLPLGAPKKIGFRRSTAEENGVRILESPDGKPLKIYYPYPINNPTSFKVRDYTKIHTDSKGFGTVGQRNPSSYFGQGTLTPGRSKRLIVVEGEADRLALIDLMKYAGIENLPDVISVPVMNALAVASTHRDTFIKYESVYIAFDSGPSERRLKHERDGIKRGYEGSQDFFAGLAYGNAHFLEWPIEADEDQDGKVDARDWCTWLRKTEAATPDEARFAFWGLLKESPLYQSPEIFDFTGVTEEEMIPTNEASGLNVTFAPETSKLLGGFGRPCLGVVTAPVGVGKTSFLLEAALDLVANGGTKVGLIALEDDVKSSVQHLTARVNNIHPGRYMQDPSLIDDAGRQKARDVLGNNLKLVTGDRQNGRMNAEGMKSIILEMATTHGCKVIIYDNITYISQGASGNQREEIERAMQDLEQISKNLQVNIIVVVQLGRQHTAAMIPQETPYVYPIRKEHLKGSGTLEGNATWVLCGCPEINPDGTKTRVAWHNDKMRRVGGLGVGEVLTMCPLTGAMVTSTEPYRWPWEPAAPATQEDDNIAEALGL